MNLAPLAAGRRPTPPGHMPISTSHDLRPQLAGELLSQLADQHLERDRLWDEIRILVESPTKADTYPQALQALNERLFSTQERIIQIDRAMLLTRVWPRTTGRAST